MGFFDPFHRLAYQLDRQIVWILSTQTSKNVQKGKITGISDLDNPINQSVFSAG